MLSLGSTIVPTTTAENEVSVVASYYTQVGEVLQGIVRKLVLSKEYQGVDEAYSSGGPTSESALILPVFSIAPG